MKLKLAHITRLKARDGIALVSVPSEADKAPARASDRWDKVTSSAVRSVKAHDAYTHEADEIAKRIQPKVRRHG